MQSDLPNRELIERAEDLILRLRDVHSCRISTDETGEITEVHVVATTKRLPKMIARDVETCLKAELNLEVDYRKIGVVIIDPMKETDPAKRPPASPGSPGVEDTDRIVEERLSEFPAIDAGLAGGAVGGAAPAGEMAPDPAPEHDAPVVRPVAAEGRPERISHRAGTADERSMSLEFLEEDVRIRFGGLRLSIEETRVDAEVKLEKNGLEVVGCLGAYRTGEPIYETIATAAIHAVMELLDERFHLCLSTVEEINVSGAKALLAVVNMIDGRTVRNFAGCVFVGRDPNEAAVLAVLDALNRPSGRWKSRSEIHYRIR